MIDGKSVRKRLIGSDNERAVSPVIGVILMVAITVILAAVIAAFVLDMGQSQSATANAGVSFDGNETYVEVQVTDMGNSDTVNVTSSAGSVTSSSGSCSGSSCQVDGVGDTVVVDNTGGNAVDVTVVAISGDDENVINNYPQ